MLEGGGRLRRRILLAGPSEAAVDKLVADLNRAGLQKVQAEYQKQIDAFLASKN
jgi:hypothetical protein